MSNLLFRPLSVAVTIFALVGCGGEGTHSDPDASAPTVAPITLPTPAPVVTPAVHRAIRAGETISIPAGTVRVGSRPNSFGRLAENEAREIPVQVAAFSIDRLPYPNDPTLPRRTSVTRDEAAALCEADGKRLCSEYEWERACEGDANAMFAGGASFDVETCSMDPLACASSFDVVGMGVMAAEWTTGMMPGVEAPTGMIRGADYFATADRHRCAARRGVLTTASADTLGFRCCSGGAPVAAYPPIEARPMFEDRNMSVDEIKAVLGRVPELANFAETYRPLTPTEIEHPLARGNHLRGWLGEWQLVNRMLIWAPAPGEEAWIITGKTSTTSFVAALLPMPDGSFIDIGSFTLRGESLPIALAYNPANPRELLFSTCWGCGGESGAVLYREDSTFTIVPR